MSIPDNYKSGSSQSSHHHHHHSGKKRKHMDDSDRFKKHGLSSIRRSKILSRLLWGALVLAAIAVIVTVIIVYTQVPVTKYK